MVNSISITDDAIKKARLRYKLNVKEIPRARFVGYVLLCLFVTLHNHLIFGRVYWGTVILYSISVFAFSLISWVLLHFQYTKNQNWHLSTTFLILDVLLFTWAIYITGGNESYLFFILAIRTADQVVTSVKKVTLFAAITLLAYLGLLLILYFVEGKEIREAPSL